MSGHSPGFYAARRDFHEWRDSFTSIGWEREQIRRRQEHIDNGATVRPDGRLEFVTTISVKT